MLAIFLETLPFFAVIALGYGAGRIGFFSEDATATLTRFVFYFALSAMLFRFSAGLDLAEVLDWTLIGAYLWGTLTVYLVATLAGLMRRLPFEEMAIEAQCAVIGNTGFLGVPMLALLLGEAAVGPVLQVLAVDLIVFSSLITVLISARREGRVTPATLRAVALGLAKNPMVMAMVAGLSWSALALPLPGPADRFLSLLGAAATPGALFAIGASLAFKNAERLSTAAWLSFAKLVLHPAAVALAVLVLFPVERFAAGVVIAAAAMPVAGNVYILAQHFGAAPARVSAAILVSTTASVATLTAVIAWVSTM